MRKLSQRVAGLTPSITAGLIFFAVGLTALLAYRAFEASRAQHQVVEHTLQDYAGFAAFQLKNATYARIAGQHRAASDAVLRFGNLVVGPTPPVPPGADRIKEIIDARRLQCHCLDGVSFYYQVTFSDKRVETTASPLATAETAQWIRDTVIASAIAFTRRDPSAPPPAGPAPPVPSLYFVTIFSPLGGVPYAFAHTFTADTAGPVIAYGYAVPAETLLSGMVPAVLQTQPVLPTTLTRGMRIDSLLAVTVSDASRRLIYESDPNVGHRYAATDSLDMRQGGLRFEVAINPAAAGRLIIGGVPRSRLPEVLATAFVSVCLLGLLLYQFRRQEELGRLRNDFVSGVSHELRTPLAQIRLLAELLRMGKVPTEKQDRSLRIIDKEARRLAFLVESILSFTRSHPERLSFVSTDVATEIEEIISGFEPLAQAHDVRLTTRLERGIVAEVDRGALRQILLNLLDNAVRYGPPRQNVTVTTTSAGDTWTLEVADEGPGIPADESERVFAPYYRMKRDAGGPVGGTGIGLAVVRRLVEEHRGRVRVVPTHGNGACGARFVLSLPITVVSVN